MQLRWRCKRAAVLQALDDEEAAGFVVNDDTGDAEIDAAGGLQQPGERPPLGCRVAAHQCMRLAILLCAIVRAVLSGHTGAFWLKQGYILMY
jgi:hypothetical protein